MEYYSFMILITFTFSFSFVIMLAACLCCKKRVPKNDLLGLQGIVTLKSIEEHANGEVSLNPIDGSNDGEMKMSTNATHRSLPDIPISESLTGDTNSDLYATVHEKSEKYLNSLVSKNQTPANDSQNSLLSQIDDASSPYASVRSPQHAYDQVRSPNAEHPYALLQGTSSTEANQSQSYEDTTDASEFDPLRDDSNSNLGSVGHERSEILAASAIAGRVSANQDLPYMTPPIGPSDVNFSGDSQDSSKGYTSITVREPLANILAQTNTRTTSNRQKEFADSHYATVSDDSDEMYAAIEDRVTHAELYTSGSETYAQIQPPTNNQFNIIAEINTESNIESNRESATIHEEIVLPTSTTTTGGQEVLTNAGISFSNMNSPKPEKRQANSPLPPTPKSTQYLSNSSLATSHATQSNRNSTGSMIDANNMLGATAKIDLKKISDNSMKPILQKTGDKKESGVAKNLEMMYAKVNKRNKVNNFSSPVISPVASRKQTLSHYSATDKLVQSVPNYETLEKKGVSDDETDSSNKYETIGKKAAGKRSNDPGYETIASRKNSDRSARGPSRSDPQYETLRNTSDKTGSFIREEPGYESLAIDKTEKLSDLSGYETVKLAAEKPNSDYDPNYEILKPRVEEENDYLSIGHASILSNEHYSVIKNASPSERRKTIEEPHYNKIVDESEVISNTYMDIDIRDSENNVQNDYSSIKKNKSSDNQTATTNQHSDHYGIDRHNTLRSNHTEEATYETVSDPPFKRINNDGYSSIRKKTTDNIDKSDAI